MSPSAVLYTLNYTNNSITSLDRQLICCDPLQLMQCTQCTRQITVERYEKMRSYVPVEATRRAASGPFLLLPDDVWGEVCSYFSRDEEVSRLLVLSKRLRLVVLRLAAMSIRINRYHVRDWEAVGNWLLQFDRLVHVEVSSSSCRNLHISSLLGQLARKYNRTDCCRKPSIFISKCFLLNEDLLECSKGFEEFALCDVAFVKPIQPPSFSGLKSLSLTNSVFNVGVLQPLFDNFPANLSLLALGGSKQIALGYGEDTSRCPIYSRDDLCLEVTFVALTPDAEFLNSIFPKSSFVDFSRDTVATSASLVKTFDMSNALIRSMLNSHNNFNSTVLHKACRDGDVERCLWVLRQGSRTDLKDCKGGTPLQRAIEACSTCRHTTNSIWLKVQDDFDIERLPEPIWPPTSSHCFSLWRCISGCLGCGSSCFIRNQNYETPLYIAAIQGNELALYAMIVSLWKEGLLNSAEIETSVIDKKCSDYKQFSPLQAAVLSRSYYCVWLLLCAGSSPNHQNKFGSTAMHLAYRTNDNFIISILSQAGGDISIKDNSGDLPRHYSPQKHKTRNKTSMRKSKRGKSSQQANKTELVT